VYERLTPPEQIAGIETAKFIEEGKEIFHSPDKLGGTIGVSCDMCHPDAVKTHPETYPTHQTQLQRVARLRDMINWCIENPVKGQPLNPDDPYLRALEAYIGTYSPRSIYLGAEVIVRVA
jgi:cytochrome c